ncbi:hypothetical protein G7007_19235 [Pseudomonas entomophila]|uniref:hypothetical protein n=1 Tax=Pseudomonas entomophila TaxID=312306 RepID=UPI0015E429EC|nr:hypothetical protein [Pseudomonas entomophila]MBA1194963.1 hypothetical protein [Pseudomonas entomophila]
MSQDDQSRFVVEVLDLAGKVVAGSGLVLGLAYLSGWVYWRTYLECIDIVWTLEAFNAQSLVQAGLPWVAYCIVLSCVIFFGTKKAIHISKLVFWFVFLCVVIFSFLAGVAYYAKPAVELDSAWKLQYLFYGAVAAIFIALGFRVLIEDRLHEEGPRPKNALVQFSFALAWMVLGSPFTYAYSQVKDIQCNDVYGVKVVHANGNSGALVAIIGDKAIIKDSLEDKAYIYTVGDALSFQKAKLVGHFPGFACARR